MGRVRRYKKLKACDPCAKRQPGGGLPPSGGKKDKIEYDLPPRADSDEEDLSAYLKGVDPSMTTTTTASSKKRRRQEKRWAEDALRDDEYIEMLEDKAKKARKPALPEISIQSKQPNESMKAFQHRVRLESRALLKASNDANSSTKAKKREYLKRKKMEKKRKAKGLPPLDADDMSGDEEGGGSGGHGGGADGWNAKGERVRSFATREYVPFGQTNDAPPDLRLPRLQAKTKPAAGAGAGAGGGARKGQEQQQQDQADPKKKKKATQTPAEKAKWDKLREEAQQAYRAMKAKK